MPLAIHRVATAFAVLLVTGQAWASGYRVPEQSINSVATASASIAAVDGPDSAYFNPAAMSWLDGQHWQTEAALLYINLPHITYTDNLSPARNGSSQTEDFLLPVLHTVSPTFNGMRFGFALSYPAGLSKRWTDPFPRLFSEDFSLRVVEANPTLSYKINDSVSIAGGLRLLRASGQVRTSGIIAPSSLGGSVYTSIARFMEGDAMAFGYNLAASWRPSSSLTLAATYRSRVDLDLEGDAALSSSTGFTASGAAFAALPAGFYQGSAGVSIPVPAVLTLGAAWTIDRSTLEFAFDRTWWDAYQHLDFEYSSPLSHPVLASAFDEPRAKLWTNTDAYRISLTQRLTDALSLRLGFAIDGNPVPDATLGFELPDSNARSYACGLRYRVNDRLDAGISYLYTDKKTRSVNQSASGGSINGSFTDSSAHMFALGVAGRF